MRPKATLRPCLVLAGSSLFAISSASAASYWWDNNGTATGFGSADLTTWSSLGSNLWSGSSAGGTDATLGTNVVTTTSDTLTFGTGTNGLATGTITVSGTVNVGTITGSNPGASPATVTFSSGAINFASAGTITVGSNTKYYIDSQITGASTSLNKTGSTGTLRLTNSNNSYTGYTGIVGTLELTSLTNGGSNSSIGSSSSAASNLRLGGGGGVGTLSYIGSGNASTDRSFTLNDSAGSVISNDGSGTLEFSSTSGLAYGSSASGQTRALTLGGSYTGGQNTFRPLIENNGTNATSFIKSGNSTWILANNSNSYTGTTNVAGGTLVIGSIADYGTNSAIGQGTSGAGIIVANGNASGTLIYTGGAQETNRLIQISTTTNAASGIATILNNGTGKLTFTSATFNPTYTNANNLTRTLALGGTNDGVIQGTIQDSSATVKNALTKIGSGTWTLSGTNTYTGATSISGGILQFAKVNSLYNGTAASWSAGNIRVASGGTLAFNVGGTGEFTSSDVGTLFTNLANSTNATTNGMAAGSNFGFDTSHAIGGSFEISQVVANSGGTAGGARGLTKLGTGTLVLSNTNTYTGATTVSAGTLYVTGALSNSAVTVQANGTVGSNGSTGSLGNGLTIEAGGDLNLAGATLGLNSAGILSLTGGTLTLGNLTFQDLAGWNWADAAEGSYELIDGTFGIDWGSTAYLSEATAYDFGNGKKGYFTSGSLNAVIVAVPEPRAALLGGLGLLMLLRRRRD